LWVEFPPVKRSRRIQLVLLSGLSAGALSGCGPSDSRSPVSTDAVYTNDHHIAGAGYYHAPYRRWYPQPYNKYDPSTQLYFHGGQWTDSPLQTITNISAPTAEAVQQVRAALMPVVSRGGFGSTSRSHFVYS